MIYTLEDRQVVVEGVCFIAPSAAVVGRVVLKHHASIWFGAVLRGDYELITVGENSNIQDCAVMHTDPGSPCTVGNGVTVGHQATLHGCEVGDNSLIGINAVILNDAKIGKNCLIGSNALVTEGKEIPDNSLVIGSPGKIVRELTQEEIDANIEFSERYVNNLKRYIETFQIQDNSL
ncbi:MAG: gamma carbonic anhydrase family protein [Gammaproteobacteria bacterium]|nr:gamma carbonic anhydrase family protein [Gammaproteobacteria bacterium]